MIAVENIRNIVGNNVGINVPLAPMTSFKIGGSADLFIEPNDAQQLVDAIRYLEQSDYKYIIIGNGSNVLISDDGFRGAAISLAEGFSSVDSSDEGVISAGAGIKLSAFVNYCVNNGYAGFEMLAGIPGTLGGAIIMNAGAYGGEISEHVIDVTVIRNATLLTISKVQCNFGYRSSDLNDDIVVGARFQGHAGDVETLKKKRRELVQKRNAAQPVTHLNAGSIFKNPPGRYAAKLIEECGLKGYSVGRAEVSELHANFIVCSKSASANDVVDIMNKVRKEVYRKFDIVLEPEIKLIGFGPQVLEPIDS